MTDLSSDYDEPTLADLAEIEREWPLIEAEIALIEAEILVLSAEPSPAELDWRRVRRAVRRVEREAIAFHGRPTRVVLLKDAA